MNLIHSFDEYLSSFKLDFNDNDDDKEEYDEKTKKINEESHRYHLPFLCVVAALFILISLLNIHLFKEKEDFRSRNLEDFSFGSIDFYDYHLREIAIVLSLIIIILNCFALMIFTLEIYLNDQLMERITAVAATSSSCQFIALSSFYLSIPGLILVMCLFILLNLSFTSALVSLLVLGISLCFIIFTLIKYYFTWKRIDVMSTNKSIHSIYQTINGVQLSHDALSTLV